MTSDSPQVIKRSTSRRHHFDEVLIMPRIIAITQIQDQPSSCDNPAAFRILFNGDKGEILGQKQAGTQVLRLKQGHALGCRRATQISWELDQRIGSQIGVKDLKDCLLVWATWTLPVLDERATCLDSFDLQIQQTDRQNSGGSGWSGPPYIRACFICHTGLAYLKNSNNFMQ